MSAFDRTYTPGSKTAVFYNKDMYLRVIRHILRRVEPPKLLKDRHYLEAKGLIFPSHHFLFEIFDRKLQQYIEADLINYNLREWVEWNNPKTYKTAEETFAVLTLGELEAGFVISIVPLVLSIVVFFIEWIPTLKNLVVFLFIFNEYFHVKNIEQSEHIKIFKIKIALWQSIIQEKAKETL